ncbi:DNA endonuclease RBBP8, partial [Orchesella cincta]
IKVLPVPGYSTDKENGLRRQTWKTRRSLGRIGMICTAMCWTLTVLLRRIIVLTASSLEPPSSSFLVGALISRGLRPKDAVLNLLLDAVSVKFAELERNAESPQQNSALLPPTVEFKDPGLTLNRPTQVDDDEETDDDDTFFKSPSLMNYNLKSLNYSRAKTPSPVIKNESKLNPKDSLGKDANIDGAEPFRRQLYVDVEPIFKRAATPELIECNDNDTGFLEDSPAVIEATPPFRPLPRSKNSTQEPANNGNKTLDESVISLDATILPPPKHSFVVTKKKKEAWVDANIPRQKSRLSTNPKRMRQVNLLTMARNFPQKKVDVTTLKEYNGGTLSSSSEVTSDDCENVKIASGSKRKSDEIMEKKKEKKDKLDSSGLSETFFEVSPIKDIKVVIPLHKQKEEFRTPPSSPKASTSAGVTRNKPLSPVQDNLINKDPPTKVTGFGKQRLESTMDLIKDFDKIPKRGSPSPNFRYKEKTVRKKTERALLAGHECHDCQQYYAGLESQLDEKEIARIINRCSRHRSKAPPVNLNNTPPDFWSTHVPKTQELYKTGQIKVASYCFTPPKRRPPRNSSDDESDDDRY